MNKILVPIDGSSQANRAVQTAVSICKGRENECHITLLHVSIEASRYAEAGIALNVDIDETAHQEGETLLKMIAQTIPDNGIEVEIVHLAGFPAEGISEFARKENYDMIVMGSRGLGALGEVILGSVSHRVLHEAACPVVIVK
ncbi:universal stress protein [Aneurinibacillus terranovensis]|uniref:universal stress protein n=1 Tax=Aneurinibacillus terranovensis TaxID=278991 RepID=UPI00040FA306|nr:universal stress protein [Aneurinibacillus terranovensis]